MDIQISFVPNSGDDATIVPPTFPAEGSDVHFNADAKWTLGSDEGYNLYQVAVLKAGEAVGLSHVHLPSDVMSLRYPITFDPNFKLHTDEIKVSGVCEAIFFNLFACLSI